MISKITKWLFSNAFYSLYKNEESFSQAEKLLKTHKNGEEIFEIQSKSKSKTKSVFRNDNKSQRKNDYSSAQTSK